MSPLDLVLMRDAGLEITFVSPELLLGSFGPVSIALWRGQPTWRLFKAQHDSLVAVVARHPGRALFLCVVGPDSDPPSQDIRDASSAMVSELGTDLAGCACVIEGSGFRAAITRTVLSGIALFVRSPAPVRFFETTALACGWLESLAPPGSLRGLSGRVDAARVRHREVSGLPH